MVSTQGRPIIKFSFRDARLFRFSVFLLHFIFILFFVAFKAYTQVFFEGCNRYHPIPETCFIETDKERSIEECFTTLKKLNSSGSRFKFLYLPRYYLSELVLHPNDHLTVKYSQDRNRLKLDFFRSCSSIIYNLDNPYFTVDY